MDEGSPVVGYIFKEFGLEEKFVWNQRLWNAQKLYFLRIVLQAVEFGRRLLVMHGKEVDATGLNELELTLQMILNIVWEELVYLDETSGGQKNNIDTSFLHHNFNVH